MTTVEIHKKEVRTAQNKRYYESHKGFCREYYLANRDHIRELQRQWREKNREHIRAKSRARYAETHVRKKRSRYDVPTKTGKPVGMFLKSEDNECYEWLKNHYSKLKAKEKENEDKIAG